MGFTEPALLTYSEEHLLYELRMLLETATRLIDDQQYSIDAVTDNALLESFAVHARSLADFLFAARQQEDDIVATDYIDEADLQRWRDDLGEIPPVIQSARRRTNKEIAHLTVVRQSKDLGKGWDVRAILNEFIPPFQSFAFHAKRSRLHEKARTFIRDDFRAPSGTPTRRRLYNSTSSGTIIWGKVPPADDGPKTDIRTRSV